jgi:hypothetical protein
MAHYAFLNEDNIVTEVIAGIDETETIDGLSPEEWYGDFRGQKCVRTSYNGKIRFNYAGLGYFYDSNLDGFIAPKCHEEAVLDQSTCKWVCENVFHEAPSL